MQVGIRYQIRGSYQGDILDRHLKSGYVEPGSNRSFKSTLFAMVKRLIKCYVSHLPNMLPQLWLPFA